MISRRKHNNLGSVLDEFGSAPDELQEIIFFNDFYNCQFQMYKVNVNMHYIFTLFILHFRYPETQAMSLKRIILSVARPAT
jgi:hypothetical protein